MDPELRKMLEAAHAAGATEEQLGHLIDRWQADHIQDHPDRLQQSPVIAGSPAGPSTRPDATIALPRNRDDATGDVEATVPALLGNIANLSQGIPGVEALQAGARSLVRRQSYQDALRDIRGQTDGIPTPIKAGERMAGAAPLAALLPWSPVTTGAVLGGADQALSADPNQSMTGRVGRTAIGAATGAITGKAADLLGTAIRATRSPSASAIKLRQDATSNAVDRANYGTALSAAGTRQPTQAVLDLLQSPDFAPIADRLAQSPQFRGMSRTDPKFLSELYKTLSDKSGALEKGLVPIDPTNPNVKRVQIGDIRLLKNQLLTALEQPGPNGQPAFMPEYRSAVQTHATNAGIAKAFDKGYIAQQANPSAVNGLPLKQLTTTPPEAIARWSEQPIRSPEEKSALVQGILSRLKAQPKVTAARAFGVPIVPLPTQALRTAPSLLRAANAPEQQFADLLTKLGIVSANTPLATP